MRKSDFGGNFQNLVVFLCLRYSHICVLELDTCFLGRDMIAQTFFFHTNLTKAPPQNYCGYRYFVTSQIVIVDEVNMITLLQ